MALVGPGDGVSLPKSISWPTAASLEVAATLVDAAVLPATPCCASFNTQCQHTHSRTLSFQLPRAGPGAVE